MYFRGVTTVKSKCNGNGMLHVASKAENPLLPYLPDRKNTRNRFRTNIEITLPSKFYGEKVGIGCIVGGWWFVWKEKYARYTLKILIRINNLVCALAAEVLKLERYREE